MFHVKAGAFVINLMHAVTTVHYTSLQMESSAGLFSYALKPSHFLSGTH